MGMDPAQARKCFARAVNRGVHLLDTAYSDMCEQELGKVLNLCWRRGDARNEFFIITKLPLIAMRWNTVNRFLDMSLKKLGVDFVDAFLLEAPVGLHYISDTEVCPVDEKGNCLLDMTTDLLEVWKHVEISYTSGRTRLIGVSNFNMEQVDCLVNRARFPPSIAQFDINAYNMRCIEREKLEDLGVAVMAVYVTGNPLLQPSEKQPILRRHPTVKAIARAHNVNTVTVLIKYLIQLHIISLVKFICVDEIDKVCETLDSFTLTDAEMSALEALDLGGDARLKDFVDYKGCQNHPEFPFFYDARRPDVNRGKWKRSRNPYGTPPRYDYLDPNTAFPVNEYDNQKTHKRAQELPVITATRVYPKASAQETASSPCCDSHANHNDVMESEQITHVGDVQKEMDFEQNIANTAAHAKDNQVEFNSEQNAETSIRFSIEDTPPNALKEPKYKVCNVKDAQTQTQSQIFATSHITLTLTTKNVFLNDPPTQYRVEFDVPFQQGENTKETDMQEEKPSCFPVTKRVKIRAQSHQSPKKAPTPSIPSSAQVLTSAEVVPNQSGQEARQRKRQRAETPCNQSAEK